jgi:hypothetical protein
MSANLANALKNLGDGTDKAGEFGVLRVLISHPAKPNASTLSNLAATDASHHPIVTVDVMALATQLPERTILASLEQRIASTPKEEKSIEERVTSTIKEDKDIRQPITSTIKKNYITPSEEPPTKRRRKDCKLTDN